MIKINKVFNLKILLLLSIAFLLDISAYGLCQSEGLKLRVPVDTDMTRERLEDTLSYLNAEEKDVLHGVEETTFKPTLLETFGMNSISSIFDLGAGNGDWIRKVQKQRWLTDSASVIGLELAEPRSYTLKEDERVVPEYHWQGLKIVNGHDDERYPMERTVDLLHAAFVDIAWFAQYREEWFEECGRLVRSGGWFLFADNKFRLRPERYISWLKKKGTHIGFTMEIECLRITLKAGFGRSGIWAGLVTVVLLLEKTIL